MLGSLNNQPITIYFGGGYLAPVCCQKIGDIIAFLKKVVVILQDEL
jgi:hypothetical protein